VCEAEIGVHLLEPVVFARGHRMAGEVDDAADAIEQVRPLDLVMADRLDPRRTQRRQGVLRQETVAPDHENPAGARSAPHDR
jgi:hypothetical protein